MMTTDEILRRRPMAVPSAPVRRFAEPTAGSVRRIDPERAVGVVDPGAFTCEEVYKVFLALTFDWHPADHLVRHSPPHRPRPALPVPLHRRRLAQGLRRLHRTNPGHRPAGPGALTQTT